MAGDRGRSLGMRAVWFAAALLGGGSLVVAAAGGAGDEGDETCAADGSGNCRSSDAAAAAAAADVAASPGGATAETGVASKRRAPAPAVVAPAQQASIIAQEVEELKGIIETSQERIKLLEELHALLQSGKELPLSESHVRALKDKMPLLSEVAAEAGQAPTATSEDYLISKAVIPLDEEASFVRFMPLRSSRGSSTGGSSLSPSSSSSSSSSSSQLPSALLVAARKDGALRLFTPAGELALSFASGHERSISHLAVAPSHEEYLLATSDEAGVIRVHRVSVRQRRLSKEEKAARRSSSDEKVSQHMGSALNVTASLYKQMQMPQDEDGESAQVTSLALGSQGGSKYLLAGDALGRVNVFTRNGTLRGQIDTALSPGASIDSLSTVVGSSLFRSGRDFGYLDLEKMQATHLECPGFTGEVANAVLDSQQSTRILVSDTHGTVWVFNIKNKRECRVELQFAKGSTRAPLELASTKGFAIGVERQTTAAAAVVAMNMSQIAKKPSNKPPPDVVPPPPEHAIVWRRARPAARAWSLQKRVKEGDLLAFLSEDGREIEIIELLMQTYSVPQVDSFSNFKMPVIAVAVVLVLGYQWLKMKGKGGVGGAFAGLGGGGSKGKLDFGGDLASTLRNKKMASALKSRKF